MTEEEWRTSDEPMAMLKESRSRLRHRKLRLFAVACCRHILPLLSDERSKTAIEVAERFADSVATEKELQTARTAAHLAHRDAFKSLGKKGACLEWAAAYVADPVAFLAAKRVSSMSATARGADHFARADYSLQANLVRDIFCDPFKPISFAPSWLTPAVIGLASYIYEERAFARMPDLALILEARGCTEVSILEHCRQSNEHIRGCWVLDLLLGKE